MGRTTKFDIDDTAWFILEETKYGDTCSCCGGRLANSKVKSIHISKVTDIFINWYGENYNLAFPISLNGKELYLSKEEAQAALDTENKTEV